MTSIEAFIIDLDGTLVDSLQDITDALNAALAEFSLPPADRACVRKWVGDGLPTLCHRALRNEQFARLGALISAAKQRFAEHGVVHSRPYPKILQILELLKSRGAKLAVLSNKPDDLTQEMIAALSLRPFFTIVRGCVREEDRKPSPKSALEIAATWGARPGSICMVGDSTIDVQMAKNAGMKSIAVTWGFRDRKELEEAGADYLIDDPEEILQIFYSG